SMVGWIRPQARVGHTIPGKAVMTEVPAAEDALALEAGPLDHALGRLVADGDEAVETEHTRRLEGPIGEPAERPRAYPAAARARHEPEADRGLMTFGSEERHSAEQAIRCRLDDREWRPGPIAPHRPRAGDEGVRVGRPIRLRDRHP